MARGLPYDSDSGRDYAAAITALMSGASYAQSARIAGAMGPFAEYELNREPMLRVMRKHREATKRIDSAHVPLELLQAAKQSWDEVVELGETLWPAQQPDLGARPDRHDRLHDGLRHHRRRARHRPRQVQEAGRRRHDQDRQQHGAEGAQAAGLRQDADPGDRRVHRRERHDRGRAASEGGAPAGLRLRLQAGQGLALDPLHGPPQDAGRGAAVHLGRDQQDDQHARGLDAGRHHAGLHRGLADGAQGGGDLPRQLQAQPAAVDQEGRASRRAGRRSVRAPGAARASCPTSAARSPTSSRSTSTRAI